MIAEKNIIIVGGGTGGHINAAITLGDRLKEDRNIVTYLTGKRHLDYRLYKGQNVVHLDSFPLKIKNPLSVFKNIVKNFLVFLKVLFLIKKIKPLCMFGAGGYVCGPTLLAGFVSRVPIFILEQNSVMGLTNRILGRIADKIFVSFDHTIGLSKSLNAKVVNSGNPIRKSFYLENFHGDISEKFRILVFGGSLGSLDINRLIQTFLIQKHDEPIEIVHQVGKDNHFVVEKDKISPNVVYNQCEYIDDICTEYKKSDLIVCRSGASSISELKVVGKPVVLIPLTIHKDKHQVHNASELKRSAKFNVYVNQISELVDDNCAIFKKIIKDEIDLKKNKVNPHRVNNAFVNSAEVILREVEGYVFRKY